MYSYKISRFNICAPYKRFIQRGLIITDPTYSAYNYVRITLDRHEVGSKSMVLNPIYEGMAIYDEIPGSKYESHEREECYATITSDSVIKKELIRNHTQVSNSG